MFFNWMFSLEFTLVFILFSNNFLPTKSWTVLLRRLSIEVNWTLKPSIRIRIHHKILNFKIMQTAYMFVYKCQLMPNLNSLDHPYITNSEFLSSWIFTIKCGQSLKGVTVCNVVYRLQDPTLSHHKLNLKYYLYLHNYQTISVVPLGLDFHFDIR
jgi:hypothetical protein